MAKNDEIFQGKFASTIQRQITDADLYEQIVPVGELNTQEVVQVYTNDYYARLTEALGDHYESIWTVLGDDAFFEMARSYICSFPSAHQDLNNYGDSFPIFLKNTSFQGEFPFLFDLANYENNFWKVFHSPSILGAVEFSDLDIETILSVKLSFIDNLAVYSWSYRVYDLWKIRNKNIENINIELEAEQRIMIFKSTSSQVQVLELSENQATLMRELIQGKCLNEIFEEVEPEPEELQEIFQYMNQYKLLKLIS